MSSLEMKIEVEIKAWLDDPAAVEELLRGRGEFLDEHFYRDTYFTFAQSSGYQEQRFRVREDTGRTVVTAKQKMKSQAGEVNRECEFEVSDAQAFMAFAEQFGFRVMLRKEKRLRRYRVGPSRPNEPEITVELVEVPGLGRFIEVEALVDSPDQVTIAQQKARQIISELGIPAHRIEPQPYTLLLYNKTRSSADP